MASNITGQSIATYEPLNIKGSRSTAEMYKKAEKGTSRKMITAKKFEEMKGGSMSGSNRDNMRLYNPSVEVPYFKGGNLTPGFATGGDQRKKELKRKKEMMEEREKVRGDFL